MNEKEVAELRRRYKPEKSSITHVKGCCVNSEKEIIARFDQSLGLLGEDDNNMIFATLRKTLSGGVGKNLTDIVFTTQQVVDSEEHRLLMALRDSDLKDEGAVEALYRTVADHVEWEGNYLILLARDAYDVPFRSGDGEDQGDAGAETYRSILCSICPVKMTKPALSYRANENKFGHIAIDWAVTAPELGFLFPAFNDRSTDIYSALYYCRNSADTHPDLVDALFKVAPPMPVETQRETFRGVLMDSFSDDCSLEVVQGVQDKMRELVALHKESKEPQPLTLTQKAAKRLLTACGATQEQAETFEARCAAEFGEDAELSPQNLVDMKQTEIKTPSVTIRVDPDRGDLVESRVIDGKKYILIRADEGVEVNGVSIHIKAD